MPSELLTIKETAEVLGVHRNTVTRWMRLGVLTPAVAGSGVSTRFRRSDIDRLLQREPAERSAS